MDYHNSPNPNLATEYRCALCGVTHRSDEDKEVFEAHKQWNRNLRVATVPERYYRYDQ